MGESEWMAGDHAETRRAETLAEGGANRGVFVKLKVSARNCKSNLLRSFVFFTSDMSIPRENEGVGRLVALLRNDVGAAQERTGAL
jgi:hypothetical protein